MGRFQPAFLGGLFIGILSALPVVSIANVCCCLWVVAGGALTVYLMQQRQAEPVESGEAALFGLVAGLVGGLLHVTLVGVLFSGAMGGQLIEQVRATVEGNPELPVEVRDRVLGIVGSGAFVLIFAAVLIPTYAVFSMLGALLGVAIFRKKTPPGPPTSNQWMTS
jgi:hypothetical protein